MNRMLQLTMSRRKTALSRARYGVVSALLAALLLLAPSCGPAKEEAPTAPSPAVEPTPEIAQEPAQEPIVIQELAPDPDPAPEPEPEPDLDPDPEPEPEPDPEPAPDAVAEAREAEARAALAKAQASAAALRQRVEADEHAAAAAPDLLGEAMARIAAAEGLAAEDPGKAVEEFRAAAGHFEQVLAAVEARKQLVDEVAKSRRAAENARTKATTDAVLEFAAPLYEEGEAHMKAAADAGDDLEQARAALAQAAEAYRKAADQSQQAVGERLAQARQVAEAARDQARTDAVREIAGDILEAADAHFAAADAAVEDPTKVREFESAAAKYAEALAQVKEREALADARSRAEAAREAARAEKVIAVAQPTVASADERFAAAQAADAPAKARAQFEAAAALYEEALKRAEAHDRLIEEAAAARKAAAEARTRFTPADRDAAGAEYLAAETAWTAAENAGSDPVRLKAMYDFARSSYEQALNAARVRREGTGAAVEQALVQAKDSATQARAALTDAQRALAPELAAEADHAWAEAGRVEPDDRATARDLYNLAREKYARASAAAQQAPRADIAEELRRQGVTVSAAGDGQFRTVGEAVAAVEPNTPILIKPGLYREAVVIDKPLLLIGDGPVGDIRIESLDADCITMKTDKAVVHGLTLRSAASPNERGVYTVFVGQGRLLLEYCDISSSSLSAVAAFGSGTNPVIRRCVIQESGEAGLFFYEGAQGTVENCEIVGNQLAGIQTKSAANPLVRNCRIANSRGSGIFINDGGMGTFENCDISGNELAGVSVTREGNPNLRGCVISGNRNFGVRVYEGGRGSFEDCTLADNTPEAWFIGPDCQVQRSGSTE